MSVLVKYSLFVISLYTFWRMCFAYLLNEIDASLEVQPEVDEGPFNALPLVLLLLQDEHVVVEKLLQFLICEVDAQLLKAVELQ